MCVRVENSRVRVPKVGMIKIRQSQPVDLPTKSATVKQDTSGRWFVTLKACFEMPDVALPDASVANFAGIDLGLKDFAVLSDGTRVKAPKFLRKGHRKLARAQRALSRCKTGSNRRKKAKSRVAKLHAKIGDNRSDFVHKLTTDLVRKFDGIAIEDLNVKGLARTKLAKSVHDAAWGEFARQLKYKCEWNRKHFVAADRWFPSTKTCYECKVKNDDISLDDRTWTCQCGATLDRDLNAARNIRDEGLKILAGVNSES